MEKLEKYFSYSTSETIVQLIKSLFVGGVATLVDMGILFVFSKVLGIYYMTGAVIGYIIGLIVNYILSTYWVFNRRSLDNSKLEFTVFAVIAIIGLGLNLLIIWVMHEAFGVDEMIGKVVSTILVYIWNFIARKVVLYK